MTEAMETAHTSERKEIKTENGRKQLTIQAAHVRDFAAVLSLSLIHIFAKRILQENGMQTAILVTADYHMARARMLAKPEGLCITTSRAKSDWPGTWFSRVRECLSWIKYGLGLSNG